MNECYTGGRMMGKLKCKHCKFIYCARCDKKVRKIEDFKI